MSSSSLYQPRPILTHSHSQPANTDYRPYHPDASRLPLRESTGNTAIHTQQPNYHQVPASCTYPSPAGILSPASSMHQQQLPPPPSSAVVPSQSFDCLRGLHTSRPSPASRGYGGGSSTKRRGGQGINPLYFWPQFRQYRNRQAHKDTQKDKGGVWRRPELEDAFVDCKFTHPGHCRQEAQQY